MTKTTLTISPKDWGDLITKYHPSSKRLTFADFTDGTVNIDTDSTGSINKCKGSQNYNATLLAAATKDQFEAIFSDGARHLLVVQSGEIKYSSGDTIFNTVVNGTGFSTAANFEFATTQDRVYGGNASDDPIVYDRSTSYGGVAYTAPRIKDMGAQAPSSAPTAGAPTAGGNVPNGAHTYKITFLYYDSEESNGSPASGAQTAGAGNNTIPLTTIPIGGYGVTARKIYRDNNDGLYIHIATLANNTATTFSDTINVGPTPTEIPLFNNAPPSFGLLTLWLDKLWASKVPGDPYTLFYSETAMPDIFRPENQILCNQEDPITAHVVYFDRLIVFNRRSLGQILGKTPDTFRYAAIPSSIGCVDNRTLQTRVIEGVPVLIWLSDRGFYSYDGNAINYISDVIEDLVNFNIQQAVQQKNSNTQTTQSHFQGGTSSSGIDLTSVPGSITTKGYVDGTSVVGTNPRRNWDDQTDWENGSVKTNIVTRDDTNQLKNPTRFAPTLASGQLTNSIIDGTDLELTIVSDHTGESTHNHTSAGSLNFVGRTAWAQPVTFVRGGTITSFLVHFVTQSGSRQYRCKIWRGTSVSPGIVAFTGSIITPTFLHFDRTESTTITVTDNETIWFGAEIIGGAPSANDAHVGSSGSSTGYSGPAKGFSGVWGDLFSANARINGSYVFTQAATPKSGSWVSGTHDTSSIYISPTLNITHTGAYPSGSFLSGAYSTSGVTRLEGSNDPNFSGGAEVFEEFNNVNGLQNFTISGKRYWRIRLSISTTDDRATPSIGTPILKFNQTCTWESEALDMTADVTFYDSLSIVSAAPAGTSVTITVASSNDNVSYPDGFVTFGTVVVRRYIKIRAALSSSSDGVSTPTISSIILRWTLTSNLISSAIDTGVTPPAGWDVFLASVTENGGTVSFEMRSATSSGGLTAATFFAVSTGSIPSSVTPLQFTQWRVTIVSSDNEVPQVDSVTVQWLISVISSIRPASIFVDGRYYVSLALFEEVINTVLLEFDLNGKWRRRNDLSISTFSYFFNRPYLGIATEGRIRKFLEGFTNAGVNISVDVRTKALDFSTTQFDNHSDRVKVVGEIVLQGRGTGASYQLAYSVDEGQTFTIMKLDSGSTTFTSVDDGKNFYVRFRPEWETGAISGRTVMYRLTNSDAYEVEIHSLKALAFVREQSPVITG